MAQPTKFVPSYDFSDFQAASPNDPLPAAQVDAQLALLKTTTDETIDNLGLIQKDDGTLANLSVGTDQLSLPAMRVLNGWLPRGPWVTATEYAVKDVVSNGGVSYVCVTKHTSGTFSTDLAADKWMAITDVPEDVAVTATGSTTARTLASRFADPRNVLDFGAVGDGVADDVEALQAAIDAGGAVYLPAGTYRVTAALVPATGTALVGEDTAGTIIRFDDAAAARLLTIENVDDVHVIGLTLDGNKVTATADYSVYLNNANRCVFENVLFKDLPGTDAGSVVVLGTSAGNKITHSRFQDCEGTGINFSGSGVTDNSVLFSEFADCGGFGVRVGDGASRNLVQGNRTTSNTLELVGVAGTSFENRVFGNHAEGCGDNGISLSGYRNIAQGNVCVGNQNAGIWSWGSFNVIQGNTCVSNNLEDAGNNWPGIGVSASFGGAGQNNVIVGNLLDDAQASPTQWNGVRIAGVSYTEWNTGQAITSGDYRYYGLNIYQATSTGTTGATPPTHTSGSASDDTVTWRYVNSFLTEAETRDNAVVGNRVVRYASAAYFDAATAWASNTLVSQDETHLGGLATTTNAAGRVTAGKELRVGATAAASYTTAQQGYFKAQSGSDVGLVLESDNDKARVTFGDGTSVKGDIQYVFASNVFDFIVNGTTELRLGPTNMRPIANMGLALGDASFRWSTVYTVDLNASGNTVLGDADADTLTINAGTTTVPSGTATANAGNSYAVTVSKMAGVITTDGLTTAAGASQAITVTNTTVAATDIIVATRTGGTSAGGTPVIRAVPSAGAITITIDNKHASAAFDGTFVVSFVVLKAG